PLRILHITVAICGRTLSISKVSVKDVKSRFPSKFGQFSRAILRSVMKSLPRVSGVTLLAAAVLILLPALAWLQYSWLNQIADADRDRRARTLQTAASQLAQDFDGEVGKGVMGLQLEPAMVEQEAWSSYAERYQTWADNAVAPDIIKSIYFVAAPDDHAAAAESLSLR